MHNLYFNDDDLCAVINGALKCKVVRSTVFEVRRNDRLRLYPKQWSARCLRNTRCDEARYVFFSSNRTVILDDRVLDRPAANALVKELGFYDFETFFVMFKRQNKLPFEGQFVRWL